MIGSRGSIYRISIKYHPADTEYFVIDSPSTRIDLERRVEWIRTRAELVKVECLGPALYFDDKETE